MAKGTYSVSPGHSNSQSNGDLKVAIVDPAKGQAGNGSNGHTTIPADYNDGGGKEKEKDKEKKEKPPAVGVVELFRFADGKDRALILMGIMAACIHGAAMPLMVMVFGEMIDTFLGNDQYLEFWTTYGANITATYNVTSVQLASNVTLLTTVCNGLNLAQVCSSLLSGNYDAFYASINKYIVYFIIIAAGTLVISILQLLGFVVSAYRQTQRIRTKLYFSILRQEIGWFDTHEPGELNSRLADDVRKIEDGVSEKLGEFFQYLCSFIAGFVVGFVYGWKLTLVILSTSPLLMLSSALLARLQVSFTTKELSAYAKAGAVAEEVLGGIRTVVAFNGQQKECDRYNSNLVAAKNQGNRKGFVGGMTMGLVYLIMFSTYALAFWYGAKLIREDDAYTAGRLLIVFFCVLIGAFSLGNASPGIQNLGTARGAAYVIYGIIDQKPSIDSSSDEGVKPDGLTGNIEFKNVFFQYPSRPDIPILQGLDLSVSVGQTVALVGASGCGKSTTVQLLQRFYDPAKGVVSVDGHDLTTLNVQWLREHIGVVSQEPVLFATTIGENIRYGRDDVTQEEVEAAARNANAADFISKLPDGYDTIVGERGAQLSGGQKQRIAIARALVRDPKILLLDEATSALDTTSEAIVQAALDKAREGRTTLVIAHRLSTIKTADVIAGFNNGVIVEKGTHDELMQLEGIYHTLVTNQTKAKKDEEDEEDGDKDTEEDSFIEDAIPVRERKTSFHRQKSMHDKAKGKDDDTKEEEEEGDDASKVSLGRIMKLNSSEAGFIFVGSFAALVNGSIQPIFGFIFASVISIFTELDYAKQEAGVFTYCMMFLGIGVAAFLANFFQEGALGVSGEMLTMRMRQMAFKGLLRQEIGWYDLQENNVGALTTRLASDASTVKGATGSQLAVALRALSSVIIGLTIGFYYSWALTLVILAFAPIIFMSGFIRMKLVQGGKKSKDNQALEEGGKVAVESIENIRTVASLSKESLFYNKFSDLTMGPYNAKMKRAPIDAVAYGFSQSVQYLVNAAVFAFGAYLIREQGLPFENMFKVFSAVVFTAMAVGQSSSFAPDLAKAKLAAGRIFAIVDREPPIDSYSTEGSTPSSAKGVVEFREVCFSYPTRPDVKVLRGLDLRVRPGQTLALVGSSGCGKSTSIQLMERFYDPASGSVSLDDQDINSLNITWLRSQISLVSQEPILFDCSIRQNIEYGDNSRQVTMDEVVAAARAANIHEFIAALPEGYETSVGDRGAQLSGGQKQRVAIARALVRDPKILLLDEATSALDTESEKIVQEALDRAREGRTCIVIAHRLSTIRNADAIAVIHNGKMAEIGTHNELMSKEGLYYTLNNAQAMAV